MKFVKTTIIDSVKRKQETWGKLIKVTNYKGYLDRLVYIKKIILNFIFERKNNLILSVFIPCINLSTGQSGFGLLKIKNKDEFKKIIMNNNSDNKELSKFLKSDVFQELVNGIDNHIVRYNKITPNFIELIPLTTGNNTVFWKKFKGLITSFKVHDQSFDIKKKSQAEQYALNLKLIVKSDLVCLHPLDSTRSNDINKNIVDYFENESNTIKLTFFVTDRGLDVGSKEVLLQNEFINYEFTNLPEDQKSTFFEQANYIVEKMLKNISSTYNSLQTKSSLLLNNKPSIIEITLNSTLKDDGALFSVIYQEQDQHSKKDWQDELLKLLKKKKLD